MPRFPDPENVGSTVNFKRSDHRRDEIIKDLLAYQAEFSLMIERLNDDNFGIDNYNLYIKDGIAATILRLKDTLAKVKTNAGYVTQRQLLNILK